MKNLKFVLIFGLVFVFSAISRASVDMECELATNRDSQVAFWDLNTGEQATMDMNSGGKLVLNTKNRSLMAVGSFDRGDDMNAAKVVITIQSKTGKFIARSESRGASNSEITTALKVVDKTGKILSLVLNCYPN